MTQPFRFAHPASIASALAAPALAALALAVLALAGCNRETAEPAQNEVPAPAIPATNVLPSAAPTPAGPDLPAPLGPEAEKGEKGARNVLLGFARALENRQFDTAFALLGGSVRGDQNEAEFGAQWSELRDISVAIVDGGIEGGAGSLYYTAQTTITAQDAAGRPVRFEGPIVLRRANDVDGASAAQLRWHLASFDVVQTN
jgi:hypothetical protein